MIARPAAPCPRRLLSILLALALLVGACAIEETERVRIESVQQATSEARSDADSTQNPTTLRVATPEGLTDIVGPALAQVGSESGVEARTVPPDTAADLRVVPIESGVDGRVIRRWSIVTAAARIDRDDVPRDQVEAATRAGRLLAAAEHVSLVNGFFAASGPVTAVPADELPARLAATSDSFALVPADTVTMRVRALGLDGVDPVTGTGDQASYPLITRARLEIVTAAPQAAELQTRLADRLAQPEPPVIRVTFTGDLIPARCVFDQIRRLGDWSAPFRVLGERLRGAEITVGSLDAAISDAGTPIGCRETFSLLAPPEVTQGFAFAGFDVITVATNHVKDCGESGPCGDRTFLDTLARLRAVGVQPVGGGATLAEARRPVVIAAHGVRFAFLGYDDIAAYYNAGAASPGTAPLDPETLMEDIRAARALADVVILLPQWGEEYTPRPTERQRRTAAQAVEAGVTLIAGNHPHVVQAAAPLGDGYVAYALGNFLFDQDWSRETTESVLLEATFRGAHLAAVHFVPLRIENRLRPVPLSGDEAKAVLQRMMAAARLND